MSSLLFLFWREGDTAYTFDDVTEESWALRVVPGSHQRGILSQCDIDKISKDTQGELCTFNAGGVLVMKPHILHASSKAAKPNHRRIVHLEFSDYKLPIGIWGPG